MGKRLPYTPRSRVRAALRKLFLRSRERAKCLKDAKYSCAYCGVKQSKAEGREVKVEVHHLNPIVWERMIDMVYETLLCDAKEMQCLCKACHKKETIVSKKDPAGCDLQIEVIKEFIK